MQPIFTTIIKPTDLQFSNTPISNSKKSLQGGTNPLPLGETLHINIPSPKTLDSRILNSNILTLSNPKSQQPAPLNHVPLAKEIKNPSPKSFSETPNKNQPLTGTTLKTWMNLPEKSPEESLLDSAGKHIKKISLITEKMFTPPSRTNKTHLPNTKVNFYFSLVR
jgi:hypothetical protein